jgi:hypothetical protein
MEKRRFRGSQFHPFPAYFLNDFGSRVSVLFSAHRKGFTPFPRHFCGVDEVLKSGLFRTFFRRLRAPSSRPSFGPVCLGVIVGVTTDETSTTPKRDATARLQKNPLLSVDELV